MTKLADRLFGNIGKSPNKARKGAVADMERLLRDHGVPFEKIGWDYYDNSLEIHGVPPDYRLNGETLKALAAEGFLKAYVNHVDAWETHYGLRDVSTEGWRVSYPHKRRDDGQIWVEKVIPGWPPEWFSTGYVVVKESTNAAGADGVSP